jgi:predicted ATPase/transcriptional regulator with XRE-family HTH domain
MEDLPFGRMVRQLRKEAGLTQEDFAEQVACSIETISKIERGERRPSRQVAERMAQVLSLPADQRTAFLRLSRLPGKGAEEAGDKPASRPADTQAVAPTLPLSPDLAVAHTALPRQLAPLPTPPTPFIGREAELGQVAALLADPTCRLLTLTGPGGIGKTRLAIEGAARYAAGNAGQVAAFVPLASVTTTDLLVPAIADALGFTFYGPADFAGQLVGYLRDRRLLLLLDGIEHLLGDATWDLLAEILRQAPSVKLLIASRERLNLQGEWVIELNGLPAPLDTPGAAFEETSAVALFLQTARRSHSGFALSADERACVARICRLVEGMPLALELAAAWVRVLPPCEIAGEIERTLDFLAAAARDLPARHRSLRAVFDHSQNLLSGEERTAFRALAVFRGGFRREAAEWVAGATLHLLTALADKSLLRRAKSGRYDMHELVRQYAAAQLAENPAEHDAARARHSSYFLTLVERREKDIKRSLQKAVLAELVAEVDNLRPAWEWALEHGQLAAIRSSLRGLSWFYEIRGWLHEGEAVFRRAAEMIGAYRPVPGTAADTELKNVVLGHLLAHQGWFCFRQGRHEQARAALQRSLELLRPLDEPIALADALTAMGMTNHLMGENATASVLLREGLALGRALGDDWVMVVCLGGLAMAANNMGDYAEAERLARECLAVARGSGNPRAIVFGISTFSLAAGPRGLHSEAQELLRESLELSSAAGDFWGIGSAFSQIGAAARAQGAFATAEYCFRESIAMFREIGDHWNVARALINLGETHAARGDGAEARAVYGDAWRMANDAQTMPAAFDALAGLAKLVAGEGDADLAAELAGFVLAHPLSSRSARARAERLRAALAPELAATVPARSLEAAIAEVLRGAAGERG